MTPIRTLIGLLLTITVASGALAGYTAGGTFVVKAEGATLVDNGGAVCDGLSGSGQGGGCLPFPSSASGREGGFVGVRDTVAGLNVAFQVCIDNNGDGICGGPQSGADACRDQIFFSHAEGGKFFNPLGPLPTSAIPGCDAAFKGYVVLLCQGEHVDRTGPHTHALSTGTIFAATGGSGYGDFCGGGGAGQPDGFVNAAAKAYVVK